MRYGELQSHNASLQGQPREEELAVLSVLGGRARGEDSHYARCAPVIVTHARSVRESEADAHDRFTQLRKPLTQKQFGTFPAAVAVSHERLAAAWDSHDRSS